MKKAILKQEVERTFGRQLTETRDFEQLSPYYYRIRARDCRQRQPAMVYVAGQKDGVVIEVCE